MSLFITSLNSGSNGNCYYIGNENEAVLVDAGLSCRETGKRMKELNLDIEKVKAIFVSHEHSDHISGIPGLSKKYQLPVYITPGTLNHAGLGPGRELAVSFLPHQPVNIGSLTITAFPKFHDAGDPHSFIIEGNGVKIGVFTDIGKTCKHVISYFKECHAVFLEANYDVEMLKNGDYPYHLKKRISGGNGHLSNTEALELFRLYKPPHMSHLILSHLSKNNNRPALVDELFNQHAGGTQIIVASRYEATSVYHITNTDVPVLKKENRRSSTKPVQLSIF
ncbi:MAG: fold metallo-hydrolase [Chitinophagaceae bacterium]|nr:fold metallo-hydrolase [Chitinophagaceae bacterium]